ncbi:hypothetical protein [uncultured Dysosmobacter sp.]|uniref:hypothetical protein n=1 Tax=uncultured Dysosmobacter sp. TaxID=2591384 RepID=UPI0026133349|nr:hypothetical protein [uncultured Dysosmobacter sp.]
MGKFYTILIMHQWQENIIEAGKPKAMLTAIATAGNFGIQNNTSGAPGVDRHSSEGP